MNFKMRQRNIHNSFGYTLIEVLVSVSIFVVSIAIPTTFFISSLRGQNKALGLRDVADHASYVLEHMSRSLRMAQKETGIPKTCLSSYGLNYEETSTRDLGPQSDTYNGPGIRFINYHGDCQEIFLDDNEKVIKQSTKQGVSWPEPLPLTASNLQVNEMKFEVLGGDQYNDIQPRVTILLGLAKQGAIIVSELRIQTTISQRNLDIEL